MIWKSTIQNNKSLSELVLHKANREAQNITLITFPYELSFLTQILK